MANRLLNIEITDLQNHLINLVYCLSTASYLEIFYWQAENQAYGKTLHTNSVLPGSL